MESEPPIEQKSVLTDKFHDADIEATKTKTAGDSETYEDGISEADQVHTDSASLKIFRPSYTIENAKTRGQTV